MFSSPPAKETSRPPPMSADAIPRPPSSPKLHGGVVSRAKKLFGESSLPVSFGMNMDRMEERGRWSESAMRPLRRRGGRRRGRAGGKSRQRINLERRGTPVGRRHAVMGKAAAINAAGKGDDVPPIEGSPPCNGAALVTALSFTKNGQEPCGRWLRDPREWSNAVVGEGAMSRQRGTRSLRRRSKKQPQRMAGRRGRPTGMGVEVTLPFESAPEVVNSSPLPQRAWGV